MSNLQWNDKRNGGIQRTWCIGGYMELVQTGHSNNSWMLVGTSPEPTKLWGLTENGAELVWWLLWGCEEWISSSSIPSDEDTHSMLSISMVSILGEIAVILKLCNFRIQLFNSTPETPNYTFWESKNQQTRIDTVRYPNEKKEEIPFHRRQYCKYGNTWNWMRLPHCGLNLSLDKIWSSLRSRWFALFLNILGLFSFRCD